MSSTLPPAGGYSPPAARTNTLAIVSLLAGILSFFGHIVPVVGGFVVALVAIVTGFIARGQIKQTDQQGMWMANAGIIIGFIHLVLGFALLLLALVLIFVVGVAVFGISAHPTPTPLPSG